MKKQNYKKALAPTHQTPPLAAAFDMPLPSNTQAERMVLGCIFLDNSLLQQAQELKLLEMDFFLFSHRRIYAAMLELAANQQAIDPVTLQDTLRIAGELENSGGAAYIASLFDGVPRFSNIRNYVLLVKKASAMRQFVHAANEIMVIGLENQDDPEEVKKRARELLFSIESIGGLSRSTWAVDILETALSRQTLQGLSTGFGELDKLLRGGGMLPGDFFVIAARTSKGKSTLAIQIASNIANRYDHPAWLLMERKPVVLYVSLEADNDDVIERALTINAQLSYDSLQKNLYTPEEKQRRNYWINRISNWRLACCDVPKMNVQDCLREAEIIKQSEGALDLVVIDYLGLLSTERKSFERIAELEAMTREIKMGAAALKVPIIVPVQINREGAKGERFKLEHLRGCGSIEQDATKALILQDPEDNSSPTGYYLDATLEKQRKGRVGMYRMFFDKNFGSFSNVDGSMQNCLPADTPKLKPGATPKGKKPTALEQVEKDLGITD